MEEAQCFRCHDVFVSYRALEVHLRNCIAPFELKRSVPWASIPPPAAYGPLREPRFRNPGLQGRRQDARERARSSAAPSTASVTQRGEAGRQRRRPFSGGAATAKCTKCGLSFQDARSLGEHFIESAAHPYSAPAPSNSWSPPMFQAKPASENDPLSRPSKKGDAAEAKVKCECGRTFKTISALTQHRKDSKRHRKDANGGMAPVEPKDGEPAGAAGGWAGDGDETDDIASEFARMLTI